MLSFFKESQCVDVIMIIRSLLIASQLFCVVIGFAMCYFVHRYIHNKSIGMQTSIDLALKDTQKVNCVFVATIFFIDIILVFGHGQVNEHFAMTLHVVLLFEAEILSVSKIVNHWHRYLLIFYPNCLDDCSDKEINKIVRLFKMAGFAGCLIMDFITISPHYECRTVKLLSNTEHNW